MPNLYISYDISTSSIASGGLSNIIILSDSEPANTVQVPLASFGNFP